jgi:hypothetical protein
MSETLLVKQPKYLITQLNKVSWQRCISLNVTSLNPERKVGRLETTIALPANHTKPTNPAIFL